MALFRYPGKKTWWYEFHFAGQKVRESAKTRSKEMARRAENARRRDLEESYHGLMLVAEGECTISADHAAPGREMMIAASGAPYRAATGGEKITMDASSLRRVHLR